MNEKEEVGKESSRQEGWLVQKVATLRGQQ